MSTPFDPRLPIPPALPDATPMARDDAHPSSTGDAAATYDDPYNRTRKRSKLPIPMERRWDRHRPGHWRSVRDQVQ